MEIKEGRSVKMEIKFRAWVEHEFIESGGCMNYHPEFHGDINEIFKNNGVEPVGKYASKITYLQFAGLKDSKRTDEYPEGQEVYVGDIFTDHFNSKARGVVKFGEYRNPCNDDWHGGHIGFYIEWHGDRGLNRKDLAYWIKVSRVIGNTFEHPELLEEL